MRRPRPYGRPSRRRHPRRARTLVSPDREFRTNERIRPVLERRICRRAARGIADPHAARSAKDCRQAENGPRNSPPGRVCFARLNLSGNPPRLPVNTPLRRRRATHGLGSTSRGAICATHPYVDAELDPAISIQVESGDLDSGRPRVGTGGSIDSNRTSGATSDGADTAGA
jgi:hypothetical protein